MQLTFTFEPKCSDCGKPLNIVVHPSRPRFDHVRRVYTFDVIPCRECLKKEAMETMYNAAKFGLISPPKGKMDELIKKVGEKISEQMKGGE